MAGCLWFSLDCIGDMLYDSVILAEEDDQLSHTPDHRQPHELETEVVQ
jgi:hypothetical protein